MTSARLAIGDMVYVRYTNYRGETTNRLLRISGAPYWGSTQWHPDPQWLIEATDVDRQVNRVFALKDMQPVPVEEHFP